MHHIFSMIEESQFKAEAGFKKNFYIFDFQTQQGFKSVSYVSTIEREDMAFEEQNIEPIGQQTKVKQKWSNRIWQQGDNFQTHWDHEISPGESVPDNAQLEGINPETLENLREQGFVPDISMPNTFKRTVAQDTSKLAAYGYYVQTEEFYTPGEDKGFYLQSAFNSEGDYIGTPEDAKYICEERGILPQKAKPDSAVCSIGWCERDQKWYGWSHRAMFGFKPGQRITREHCGFRPNNAEDAIQSVKKWHEELDRHVSVKLEDEDEKAFKIRVQFINHDSKGRYIPELNSVEEVKRGQGEYTIESVDQSKQAAIDFAESVSSAVINPFEHTSGLISESAKKLNVLNYAWYKFAGTRDKHFKDHNPRYELTLDNKTVFGVRYNKRTDTVYLVVEDTPGEEYRLSTREANLLLKKSKGFGGKRDGIKLIKGNGNYQQVSKKAKMEVEKHASVETVEKPKAPRSTKNVLDSSVFLGFYMPSIDQKRIAFVEGEDLADTKRKLDKFMSGLKNLGSDATIIKFEHRKIKDILEKLGNKQQAYLAGPVYNKVKLAGKVVKKNYLPEGVILYDETVEVPNYNGSEFEATEPLFPGNEEAVLLEIQEAVIRDQYFTGIFKNNSSKLKSIRRVRKNNKGIPFILFDTTTVSRKYIQEAEFFIERLRNKYGKGIRGKINVMAPQGKNPKMSVAITAALTPYSKEKKERALLLLEIAKNTQKHNLNSREYSKLYQEVEFLRKQDGEVAKLNRLEKKLNEISQDLVSDKLIAFHAPMYSIKQGKVFLAVEVTGLNIVQGEVYFRFIRNRKGSGSQTTTNLYSLDGTKKLV